MRPPSLAYVVPAGLGVLAGAGGVALQAAAEDGAAGAALPALLPIVDWVAIALVVAGIVAGAVMGLTRAFGMLLWVVAALWLAHHLSGHVVSWLPNSVEPGDPAALRATFGAITAGVLLVPVLIRVLGGSAGKKKTGAEPQHKPFGALVGLLVATLLLVLLLPFVRALPFVSADYARGRAPELAAGVAEHATYLYPAAHREAVR
jgi:uncharacterized membrane protein required for colicin V production